jgi:hypothetical protein
MNVRALRSRIKVVEVPSYESRRIHGTSNLSAVRDGLRVLRFILRERLNHPQGRPTTQTITERIHDDFTPAISLLLQEAEHLARRRNQLPSNVYRDSVEAVKAAFAMLLTSNTDDLQIRRQKEVYRRQAANMWALLE